MNSYRKTLSILACITALSLSNAQATFITSSDGLMVYDTVADVTWLRDGNYAATQYADSGGTQGDSDGLMSWDVAMTWADNLTVGGATEWHLPTITTSDDGGPRPSENGQTTPTDDNEFGWLWEQQRDGDSSWSSDEADPFVNIPYFIGQGSEYYWTSIEFDSDQAWNFLIDCACWGYGNKDSELFAWAVHDGNVAGVPEPSSLTLLSLGLLGLGLSRRRKKA